MSDVFIVSIQGRGHGLAAELRRRGLQVSLIDLTSQMGVWPAEDHEGPFGFFKTDSFSSTFLERLNKEDPYQLVERGWTFWTQAGPLEMRGPATQYLLKKWGWKEDWTASLSNDKPSMNFFDRKRGLGPLWPLAMAHVLANTYDLKSVDAAESRQKMPLTADFMMRFSTRNGHEKSLKWLKELDIQVWTKAEILDLADQGFSQWSGFEFKGELSGLHKARSFVWCLTSEETQFYSEKLKNKIYKNHKQDPMWCWVRYRARLTQVPEVQVLPLHFVMIGDVDSPWTHDNVIICQRTAALDQFDFWLKIPSLQRFNKEYLTHLWNKIESRWHQRIPRSQPSLVSHPQEFYYTYEELGPSPFPLFEKKKWLQHEKWKPAKNVQLHSPEQWNSYSWESIFAQQQQVGQQIWNLWKQAQIKKEKNRDREIHTP